MAKNKNTKGFTLIELLIVILIIGILAVAFLPTVLGAPSKARDTQRIAALQKIQKVLIAADLEGVEVPTAGGCVEAPDFTPYLADLGGSLPVDPQGALSATFNIWDGTANVDCDGLYGYSPNPGVTGTYSFGLFTRVENAAENGNIACSDLDAAYTGQATIIPADATTTCYALLSN